jgi:hypothetical protein
MTELLPEEERGHRGSGEDANVNDGGDRAKPFVAAGDDERARL